MSATQTQRWTYQAVANWHWRLSEISRLEGISLPDAVRETVIAGISWNEGRLAAMLTLWPEGGESSSDRWQEACETEVNAAANTLFALNSLREAWTQKGEGYRSSSAAEWWGVGDWA